MAAAGRYGLGLYGRCHRPTPGGDIIARYDSSACLLQLGLMFTVFGFVFVVFCKNGVLTWALQDSKIRIFNMDMYLGLYLV